MLSLLVLLETRTGKELNRQVIHSALLPGHTRVEIIYVATKVKSFFGGFWRPKMIPDRLVYLAGAKENRE